MSKDIIEKFYTAFQKHDAQTMASCYHPDLTFTDPVFQNLNYTEASCMWRMLIERSEGNLAIQYHDIQASDTKGTCTWEATYLFSKTGRKVHNVIQAQFTFKDGLIIQHTDYFNFWKWSRMALGLPGTLLGWSPIIKNKVRTMAHKSLNHYKKHLT